MTFLEFSPSYRHPDSFRLRISEKGKAWDLLPLRVFFFTSVSLKDHNTSLNSLPRIIGYLIWNASPCSSSGSISPPNSWTKDLKFTALYSLQIYLVAPTKNIIVFVPIPLIGSSNRNPNFLVRCFELLIRWSFGKGTLVMSSWAHSLLSSFTGFMLVCTSCCHGWTSIVCTPERKRSRKIWWRCRQWSRVYSCNNSFKPPLHKYSFWWEFFLFFSKDLCLKKHANALWVYVW